MIDQEERFQNQALCFHRDLYSVRSNKILLFLRGRRLPMVVLVPCTDGIVAYRPLWRWTGNKAKKKRRHANRVNDFTIRVFLTRLPDPCPDYYSVINPQNHRRSLSTYSGSFLPSIHLLTPPTFPNPQYTVYHSPSIASWVGAASTPTPHSFTPSIPYNVQSQA